MFYIPILRWRKNNIKKRKKKNGKTQLIVQLKYFLFGPGGRKTGK